MTVNFNAALNAYNNAAKINVGNSSSVAKTGGGDFAQAVNNKIGSTINTIRNAENTVAKSLVNQADITDVVNAATSAEVTLRTVMEIRNKMVAAYQEILRMPI